MNGWHKKARKDILFKSYMIYYCIGQYFISCINSCGVSSIFNYLYIATNMAESRPPQRWLQSLICPKPNPIVVMSSNSIWEQQSNQKGSVSSNLQCHCVGGSSSIEWQQRCLVDTTHKQRPLFLLSFHLANPSPAYVPAPCSGLNISKYLIFLSLWYVWKLLWHVLTGISEQESTFILVDFSHFCPNQESMISLSEWSKRGIT